MVRPRIGDLFSFAKHDTVAWFLLYLLQETVEWSRSYYMLLLLVPLLVEQPGTNIV